MGADPGLHDLVSAREELAGVVAYDVEARGGGAFGGGCFGVEEIRGR